MKTQTELQQLENVLISIQGRFSDSQLNQIEKESIIEHIIVACVLDNSAFTCYEVATKVLTEHDLEKLYMMKQEEDVRKYNKCLCSLDSSLVSDVPLVLDIFYHNLKITHRFIKGEPLAFNPLLN
ncbi:MULTISPECIES: hypothetical protein [Priestia]|uniref:hypothetical protein n=1 Tax=Priestia TaxID=2800373 RepID=UPI00112C07C6|nr:MULTISPECIES: hypothetical protein [Priestia]